MLLAQWEYLLYGYTLGFRVFKQYLVHRRCTLTFVEWMNALKKWKEAEGRRNEKSRRAKISDSSVLRVHFVLHYFMRLFFVSCHYSGVSLLSLNFKVLKMETSSAYSLGAQIAKEVIVKDGSFVINESTDLVFCANPSL